ncbi:MAG: hypothetical protein FOGNACKC_05077 [Anaerolineae bacterium]|nr:hypothetical protein [Anaerolineae bacterium]
MLTAGYRKFLSLTIPTFTVNPKLHLPATLAVVVVIAVGLAWLPLKYAVAAVGGSIFLALALIEPSLVLVALIPVIPFSSLATTSVGGAKAGAMELLLLLAAAIWLLKLLTAQVASGRPLAVRHGPLLLPFALLLGGLALTWLNALSIRASLIETIKWVEMAVLYLFIINLLPPQKIKWVVAVILLAGMAQAVLGLYQFVFKVGPEGFLLFGGQFLRAYGTFAQPNPYGGYLGLVLPLALSVAIWAAESTPHSRAVIWSADSPAFVNRPIRLAYRLARLAILSLPLFVMLAALFASQSRGAWLGFAAAAVVTVVVRSKKYAALFAALALVGVLALLASSISLNPGQSQTDSPLAAVTQRFVDAALIFEIKDVAITPVTDANFATVERLAHWQAARDMWRDHPWLGVGFGNYAVIYPAYAVGRWLDPLGHAHNYWLNLGAETGLLGVTVYLIFWIWSFAVLWIVVRKNRGFYQAVAAGGLGVLVHLQVHNMVDNLYVQGMYLHVAVILGICAVIYLFNKRVPSCPS